ncbi:MAG: hypothetical protein WCI02_03020 [Planctomycetota bacterium]
MVVCDGWLISREKRVTVQEDVVEEIGAFSPPNLASPSDGMDVRLIRSEGLLGYSNSLP